MNIQIPAELSPFVESMLSRGAYRDESDMLIAGLQLLKARDDLRSDVEAGILQLESGDTEDGEDVFRRLDERMARP
jgi:putative addiction module CopG family antidote